MYTINEITIDGDILVANVTITLDKQEIVANVPVKFPRDKQQVIDAIEAREKAETVKWNAEPILSAIKADIDGTLLGKAQTIAVTK